ncbi:hypothetical protein ASPWEDRAFT_39015 [Aspergillus wentii DTO 134E9]|uniref:Uncharacterized protein n=1 Tax=Aspergillus wentii DTO 134E9 TaxID=1073089 RepID=A0A1L9RR05_ASPWE|nr:uncharacterized protein ASPWEDRAFT_39015 [Aspergillus wentii DTO 134E9]KAI9928184.1 hypothetical protein MW887_002217 [Aspergillus wentii]OJJ37332.1 hypothetical protein ASPWEDRAFT_39015 [Aspergillus wentii DTO 134E9]
MADCWQPQASLPGSHWFPQGNQQCLNSAFRDLVHAFPRPRHSARVMKPRSAGSSPSSVSKRRTTMPHSSTMRRPTQPQQNQSYQTPFDAALLASAVQERRSRPISWHPASAASTGYSNPQYYSAATTADNLAAMAMPSQPINGLPSYGNENMMYPTEDLSLSMEPFPSFPELQGTDPMQQASFLQMNSGSQVDPVAWDAGTSNFPMSQPMSDGWAFDMMSMNNSMPSADVAGSSYESVPSSGGFSGPSTPDFLPIQQPDDDANALSQLAAKKPEDELVGMGLYNNPDAFMESSLQGLSGKGLKLEETFTPSADEENKNSEDDDEDDEDEDEDEADETPADKQEQPKTESFKQPSKPSMLNKSFFFEDDDLESHAVTGTQPLINLASQPCMNYGYGWI